MMLHVHLINLIAFLIIAGCFTLFYNHQATLKLFGYLEFAEQEKSGGVCRSWSAEAQRHIACNRGNRHYSDIPSASWHLESLVTWLFVWQLVQENDKGNTKALHYWHFVRGIHQWLVDSPHKSPVIRKRFHVIQMMQHLANKDNKLYLAIKIILIVICQFHNQYHFHNGWELCGKNASCLWTSTKPQNITFII